MQASSGARCAVIYHTRWGNCELIATAIATGLCETGHRPYLADTGSVASLDRKLTAVILGSPTSMSHATRQMRSFIRRHFTAEHSLISFAAFGTGFDINLDTGTRQSADEIHELLVFKGLEPLAPPFKAAVQQLKGPLVQGELERAFNYGIDLGTMLNETGSSGDRGNLRLVS